MDSRNLFETRTTYGLLRLEYGVALLTCLALAFKFHAEIRWPVFLLLFFYIDLIGYLPGAIAYRRAKDHRIGKVFYLLYNSMHCLVSGALVALLWAVFVRPEWALLAIPIHLFGDRSLFGNFMKPFGNQFEPVAHPAFSEFVKNYASVARPK
jgi:hypothetical protein